jgi:type I restriction enzyme M protein
MILAGDGHMNIKQLDSLKYPINKKYDVILANPPYGTTTDYGDLYPIPSKNGEVVFTEHMLKALNEHGRLAFIMQEGLLFRRSDRKLRRYLIENFRIDGIISLPKGVFLPYTPVKTYILFISNEKPEKNIWCYHVDNDGFELTGLRKKIQLNDLPDLLEKWIGKEVSEKSWFINIDQITKPSIEKSNYNLIPEDYNEKYRFKLEQAENYVNDEYRELLEQIGELSSQISELGKLYNLDFLKSQKIERKKIGVIFDTKTGGTPPRERSEYFDNASGLHKWVKIGDIPGTTKSGFIQPQDTLIHHTEETLTDEGLRHCNAKFIQKGTLLVAIFANAGKTGILDIDAYTNQAIVALIPKEEYKDKIIPEFAYYMILASREIFEDMARGGNQTNINKTKLESIEIPLPELSIQKEIVRALNMYSSEFYDLMAKKKLIENKLSRTYHSILVDFLLKQS